MEMKYLLSIVFVMAGCANSPYKNMSSYEKAWQASHLIDVSQTYKIGRDPCFIEIDPYTKKIIGENPGTKKVLLWGIGASYIHAKLSNWIDKKEWPSWIKNTIRSVDIVVKANVITKNYNLGIRLGSKNSKENCKV